MSVMMMCQQQQPPIEPEGETLPQPLEYYDFYDDGDDDHNGFYDEDEDDEDDAAPKAGSSGRGEALPTIPELSRKPRSKSKSKRSKSKTKSRSKSRSKGGSRSKSKGRKEKDSKTKSKTKSKKKSSKTPKQQQQPPQQTRPEALDPPETILSRSESHHIDYINNSNVINLDNILPETILSRSESHHIDYLNNNNNNNNHNHNHNNIKLNNVNNTIFSEAEESILGAMCEQQRQAFLEEQLEVLKQIEEEKASHEMAVAMARQLNLTEETNGQQLPQAYPAVVGREDPTTPRGTIVMATMVPTPTQDTRKKRLHRQTAGQTSAPVTPVS